MTLFVATMQMQIATMIAMTVIAEKTPTLASNNYV
jgi:hypothetical protein